MKVVYFYLFRPNNQCNLYLKSGFLSGLRPIIVDRR